ncbi:MAG: hypothetical protein RMY28_035100 [Nostoc sp. ChiSLP01]
MSINKRINLSGICAEFCFFTSVIPAFGKALGADITFRHCRTVPEMRKRNSCHKGNLPWLLAVNIGNNGNK